MVSFAGNFLLPLFCFFCCNAGRKVKLTKVLSSGAWRAGLFVTTAKLSEHSP